MKKEFNYTLICIPDKHYMVNTSNKIEQVMKLVEDT